MSNQSASETSDRIPYSADRSCAACRRRKVRCDKQSPCTPCVRGRHVCSYPPREPRARRVRKATIHDVATRIDNLEKTLSCVPAQTTTTTTTTKAKATATTPRSQLVRKPSLATSSSSPPSSSPEASAAAVWPVELPSPTSRLPSAAHGLGSPSDEILLDKGSSAQYFNEVLVSRVIGQERDVRTALASPDNDSVPQTPVQPSFNPMGILSSPISSQPPWNFHPSKFVAGQLWRRFVDNVDPVFKVIHVPTAEVLVYTAINDPSRASYDALALCFAIYFASTVALDRGEDCLRLLGEDWNGALLRYKTGLEQTFAQADFLEKPTVTMLQAMAVYLSALRVHNTGRAVWTLNSLAIRIAQSIGLHRDGKKLGLSPFESEIRRRLWWYLLARGTRSSEDLGLSESLSSSSDTAFGGAQLPLNLDDNDLHPDMKELPPARKGWTRLLMDLANINMTQAWSELQQLSSSSPIPPHEAREKIVARLVKKFDGMLEYCNPVIPTHKLTMTMCDFVSRKLDFVTRQQWEAHHHPEQQEMLATEETLLEALGLLEQSGAMFDDELLRAFRWSKRSYPQHHLMLFTLWNLCLQPRRACAQRALQAVSQHLSMMERPSSAGLRGPKWAILKALQARAVTLIPRSDQDHYPQYNAQRANSSAPLPADHNGDGGDGGGGMILGSTTTRELLDLSDAGMLDEMQYMPDWSTLLQGVLQEDSNFHVMM